MSNAAERSNRAADRGRHCQVRMLSMLTPLSEQFLRNVLVGKQISVVAEDCCVSGDQLYGWIQRVLTS